MNRIVVKITPPLDSYERSKIICTVEDYSIDYKTHDIEEDCIIAYGHEFSIMFMLYSLRRKKHKVSYEIIKVNPSRNYLHLMGLGRHCGSDYFRYIFKYFENYNIHTFRVIYDLVNKGILYVYNKYKDKSILDKVLLLAMNSNLKFSYTDVINEITKSSKDYKDFAYNMYYFTIGKSGDYYLLVDFTNKLREIYK